MELDGPSKMKANLRHLAKFEAKPNPKPLPHTSVTRGFEKEAFPKIVSLGSTIRSAHIHPAIQAHPIFSCVL